jgi:SAM-dependent methyltransferase
MEPDRTSESTAAGIPWVQFARARSVFRERWPSVFDLPVAGDFFAFAAPHLGSVETVLDVGATDRVWESAIRARWPRCAYKSLDVDRTNRHDYYDFADVDAQFDLVLCLEVLEHVEPQVSLEIARQCARVCKPGGRVLASVPNVHTPAIQQEFTHRTAFAYFDLAGLLAWVGLDVLAAARITFRPWRSRALHRLLAPLHRLLAVDYCQCVLVVARKPQT